MKKGFTLAELIGVIVVLALISLITIPAISKILKQNKETLCETQKENILQAARAYASDNIFTLPDQDEITLEDLIVGGYIDDKIENPATKDVYMVDPPDDSDDSVIDAENVVIIIEKVNGKKIKCHIKEDEDYPINEFSCVINND